MAVFACLAFAGLGDCSSFTLESPEILMGPRLGNWTTIERLPPIAGTYLGRLEIVRSLRVAFAFDPERRAILPAGGDKAGVSEKRFYEQGICHSPSGATR